MEQIDLTSAISYPSVTTFKVTKIFLAYDADEPGAAQIRVELKGSNGERRSFDYTGSAAATKIIALNTANLSVKSLHKRTMEMLIADFPQLAGTISGSP